MADRTGYSQKAMEHFMNPHNVGVIENPDGCGKVDNPVCGASRRPSPGGYQVPDVRVRVGDRDGQHDDRPCRGKTLEAALQITRDDVAREPRGLPPPKMHCSNLAADALHATIRDYQE
ncbi:MAG TPA: iron-sulfur cluster assembly scaffold protein [Candidatus Methanoculleus thermohydrogenotrophicum]|mgnify:CR=1 FL=1|jgi:nitrogen fixation NifU-like protein|nr:iron-sulfur cluster assembly scaffold protein [Candidatus Methanoculleus thermohydrogenotrophicum]HOB18871.1 iron-sulfur cluster assembly scaffold protein [Candidatus Methanoculleus thermohydrogenotrophicum]HPZ38623.1 iron-sulfur cluster assembly scaffold protein [Candidatus Methanoculleus thermohydrogenotrophicum]HQC91780.1 iron-sulfur cluster assembly scaffold protein [Candidatus Methanoculleus thermohydrogenotrophicum]